MLSRVQMQHFKKSTSAANLTAEASFKTGGMGAGAKKEKEAEEARQKEKEEEEARRSVARAKVTSLAP